MTFSGDFDAALVKNFVQSQLRKMGFFLNEKKTAILRNGQKKCVTGIVVNEKINVPLTYRKSIRQEVYYCKKFGIMEHIKRCSIEKTEKAYLNSLLGRVNYVLSVDSENDEMKTYKAWIIREIKALQ